MRELELELRGVDTLGLGNKDAPTEELQLEAELLVRGAQEVALARELRNAIALRSKRSALGGESNFECSNTLALGHHLSLLHARSLNHARSSVECLREERCWSLKADASRRTSLALDVDPVEKIVERALVDRDR